MSKTVRVVIAIICAFSLCVRVETQEQKNIYLPWVEWSYPMGIWQLVQPVATMNEIDNPSFEVNITDDWTTQDLGAGAAFAHSTDEQFWGVASAQITAGNGTAQMWHGVVSLPNNSTMYVQVRAYSTTAAQSRIIIRDTTTPADRATVTGTVANEWEQLSASWTNTTGGAVNVRLQIQNIAADNATDVYFDGCQLEIDTPSETTYCDGDQDGCEWVGAEHNSNSQRSALSRAGGRVREFTDFNFNIGGMISTGAAPVNTNVDEFAKLPGGQAQSFKIRSRVFTLTGAFKSDSLEDLHTDRQGLYDLLKPDAVPETAEGPQPVILRYSGASVDKEISAHYESGLEAQIRAEIDCWERVGIRFIADDPFFYQIGEESDPLDSADPATLRYFTARLRSTGQWDDTGLANNPIGVAGDVVRAVLVASDNSIYVGGDFTGWNNVVGRNYIARYIPSTDTWQTVGGAGDLSNIVFVIEEAPNGDVYIGGAFVNAGGVGADYIATWNGAAWGTVGNPDVGIAVINSVNALKFAANGDLYVGGDFTGWDNDANQARISRWDGAAYNALTFGLSNTVRAIEQDAAGIIYVGGNFLNAGGDPAADGFAQWDGTAFSAVAGINVGTNVFDIKVDLTKSVVYLGGSFASAGGDTDQSYITSFTGSAFVSLSTGANNNVNSLALASDGTLYASGQFTEIGGITIADQIAKWNGSSWAQLDINFPGAPTSQAMRVGDPDPIIERNSDLWVGFSTTGAGNIAGTVAVTNIGTEPAFPRFTISRSGGTSAIIVSIRNETTGKVLSFNYSLLDGETLTIDLRSTQKSIVSSFFGTTPSAILPNSDFGTFNLLSGENQITCFIRAAGVPTLNTFILWQDTYWGQD